MFGLIALAAKLVLDDFKTFKECRMAFVISLIVLAISFVIWIPVNKQLTLKEQEAETAKIATMTQILVDNGVDTEDASDVLTEILEIANEVK